MPVPLEVRKPPKSDAERHIVKARKTIRQRLFITVLVLAAVIGALGYTGFRGVYAYRDLAVTLSERAAEFPLTTELTRLVDELRYRYRSASNATSDSTLHLLDRHVRLGDRFRFTNDIRQVQEILLRYQTRLESQIETDESLGDRTEEREQVNRISNLSKTIASRNLIGLVEGNNSEESRLQEQDLDLLYDLSHELPTRLQARMAKIRDEVRSRYRRWIFMSWGAATFTLVLLVWLWYYVRRFVIRPFKQLLIGSRRVADGDFEYHIELDSNDELSELAKVINSGTDMFLSIQRNLNEQVEQRSREVIRNEQLASVGFLAAGVAHEINNPLASIAWSAEALETRLHRILHPTSEDGQQPAAPDLDTLRNYLRRIQDEAFRVKGITERLLDFSRLEQSQKRQLTSLSELVPDVLEMVKHLGQYRGRTIDYHSEPDILAIVSPQEIKQVVLNLVTNALDSLPENNRDSFVKIRLSMVQGEPRLLIEDNGCGMTEEVRQHLFEPFFTRKLPGRQGTGLGLPISSRIIADHGGRILAHSDGVGKGSRFEVYFENPETAKKHERKLQAA